MEVEVWSDVVCPWCFIGKRRLERALAEFPQGDQVRVRHRAFQLDPGAQTAGRPTVDVLAEKYGIDRSQAIEMMSDVTDTAAGDGLHYQLDKTLTGNTATAHRLVLWAQEREAGAALLEAVFHAYFELGQPVFTLSDLEPLLVEAGLDPAEAGEMLAGDAYVADVVEDQAMAAQLGANGVPFFVVDRKVGVAGAQPVPVLLSALEQASQR